MNYCLAYVNEVKSNDKTKVMIELAIHENAILIFQSTTTVE